jgi:2-methylcitrate dehydratase PrpD
VTDATRRIASYVIGSRWSNLPERVRHEGTRAFLNWVGCALGGCRHPAVNAALATVTEFAGPPQATILGRGQRLDLLSATLINGLSASAHAYDDTHLKSIAHPSAPTGAALLAVAERQPISGAEFLHAFVLANEIQCRLSNALTQTPAKAHVGFYMTGLTGGVGIAAAVGRLIGLDEDRMVWALGIGAAQGGGFRATHASMSSGYIPAHAGRNGIMAALLAANSFTCSEHALEARNGFADVLSTSTNWDALTGGLGEHYEVMSVAAKPYPAGCFIHPSIEACMELTRAEWSVPEQIESVELVVHPLGLGLTGRIEPTTGYDAQVSVYHWAAAVLTHRAAGFQETTDECVRDARVVALRHRVKATVDPTLAADEAKGRLVLKDGRVFTSHIEHCLGSAARPMSDHELEMKFMGQVGGVISEQRARQLIEQCWSIEKSTDVGKVAPSVWGTLQ